MNKFHIMMRDIIFFALLVMLIKITIKRAAQQQRAKTKKLPNSSSMHQLDKNFLQQLEDSKKQIIHAINAAKRHNNTKIMEQLNTIRKEILEIERKYKQNSPSTFLLGPIGTISIVLKEKKLATRLFEIKKEIGSILAPSENISPQSAQKLDK